MMIVLKFWRQFLRMVVGLTVRHVNHAKVKGPLSKRQKRYRLLLIQLRTVCIKTHFSRGVPTPFCLGCVPIQTFRFTDHINFVDKFTNDFQSIPRQVLFFCRFVKVGGGGGGGGVLGYPKVKSKP